MMVDMPRGVLSPEKRASRFWARVRKTEHCWIWQGAQSNGYGLLEVDAKRVYAHRFSYELENGPIPPGTEIDHQCRNRLCVRPLHLEAVTHRLNMLRAMAGAVNAAKTHCPAGHPYDEANTYVYQGRRNCRTCAAARRRKSSLRRVTRG